MEGRRNIGDTYGAPGSRRRGDGMVDGEDIGASREAACSTVHGTTTQERVVSDSQIMG